MIPHLRIVPDEQEEEDTKIIRTRSGYIIQEVAGAIERNSSLTGTDATGKLLHYTADLICSGGRDIWQRQMYEVAIDTIGLASPRIFHYLRGRFAELDKQAALQMTEAFFADPVNQRKIGEVALVVQMCPRRPKIKIPTISTETHRNDTWLRSAIRSPDSGAVRRVYQHAHDQRQLLHAATEMMGAVSAGELGRAIWWLKWIFEEDALVRKEFKGPGLTTLNRGPPGGKDKNNVGFFLVFVLAEGYKELAGRGMIKMHEEVQTIIDLYRTADSRLTARRRMELLFLLVQILTEVPRWRVPSAPTLIKDPIVMSRAVEQVPLFFKEVLVYPPLSRLLPKTVSRAKPKKKDVVKGVELNNQDAAYDAAMNEFFDRLS